MALKLQNRKFYPFAFAGSVLAVAIIWYLVFGFSRGQPFLTIIGAIAAFFYFWYKQHLEETKLFKELFTEFNRRYDGLNNRLNEIIRGDPTTKLKEDERSLVFDYFNLCAEEHFFHKAHYVDEAVWNAWRNGMAFFFNNPRIRDLWNEECESADERASYYGFEPPPYKTIVRESRRDVTVEVMRESTWRRDVSQGTRLEQFSVSRYFLGAPTRSVEWSQKFVDEALSYRDVRAFHNEPGVGFDPNFVFIERVYTENEGFIASFYGTVDIFKQYGHEVEPGRAPESYSRLRVKSADLLDRALKCLHISANLKDLDRS